ncbi:MAG: hypothetical protein J6I49_08495 [Bacteroidales bacterium]|nr:hypothetical protein [Bacteroidales bacterium]
MKTKHIQAGLCGSILLILQFATCVLLAGCGGGGNHTPKPKAYLRIDTPEHRYFVLDTMRYADSTIRSSDGKPYKTFPFIFEANECIEWGEKDAPKGERWVDLRYPQWNGVVFLTYKRLSSPDSLRGQVDTSARLLEKHYQFASGIDEQAYEDVAHRVYGTVWKLRGSKVASTCQFYATDSVHHFLRGALYINSVPNNDSLAPVLEYMQEDILHLVETLRWR